ncbi:MAG: DUF4112 domain-containing protein [Verrucomicrobiales bacterium]
MPDEIQRPNATEAQVDEVIPPGGKPAASASSRGGAGSGRAAFRFAFRSSSGQKIEFDENSSPVAKIIAVLLDECIRIPGTNFRIGLDPILGLLPGAGDAISAVLGTTIMGEALKKGVPKSVQAKMAWNIFLNAALGSIPVFGDAFSAYFKSNSKNYKLLRGAIDAGQTGGKKSGKWLLVLVVLVVAGFAVLSAAGAWFLLRLIYQAATGDPAA